METLKKGYTEFWLKCPVCRCEFSYNKKDINVYREVLCPSCEEPIPHSESRPLAEKKVEECINESYYSLL